MHQTDRTLNIISHKIWSILCSASNNPEQSICLATGLFHRVLEIKWPINDPHLCWCANKIIFTLRPISGDLQIKSSTNYDSHLCWCANKIICKLQITSLLMCQLVVRTGLQLGTEAEPKSVCLVSNWKIQRCLKFCESCAFSSWIFSSVLLRCAFQSSTQQIWNRPPSWWWQK